MHAQLLAIVFAVALVCTLIGFKNYVWFLSIGYGLAIAGIAITILIMSAVGALKYSTSLLVLCILLLAYGIRLAGFLIYREAKNSAYRKTLAEAAKSVSGEKKMPVPIKAAIWICASLLYVAETAPVLYRGTVSSNDSSWIIGAIIALFGICFESIADHQKSAYKKIDPHAPAMQGLYKIVRCPNYLGEMIYWTGIFVSGWPILHSTGQWILCLLGWICIIYVMFSSAKRLETRQNRNYGNREDYRYYADHTPILLPFVPLYHLVKEVKYGKE